MFLTSPYIDQAISLTENWPIRVSERYRDVTSIAHLISQVVGLERLS